MEGEKSNVALTYAPSERSTNFFPVLVLAVPDVGTLGIRMSVHADFSNISGFLFRWCFANPAAPEYERSLKLLMSFLIGSALFVFLLYLQFDAEAFTQTFLIVVGMVGFFGANPIGYVIPSAIAGHILGAAFHAVYRLFLVVQLELLRTHAAAPVARMTIMLAALFAAYAAVEAAASYDRESHIAAARSEIAVVFWTEQVLMGFDLVFVACSLVYVIVAALSNEGLNPRRLALIGLSVLAVSVTIVLCHIYFVLTNTFMYRHLPSLLVLSVHTAFASTNLFLMHSGDVKRYGAIADQEKSEAATIDLERESDHNADDSDDVN
jgi:hypothetical protein